MSQPLTYPPPAPDPVLSQGIIIRRCVALILDCILISVLGWAAVFVIAIFGIITLGLGWLAFHIIPWIPLIYYTVLIGNSGATPGQRAMGLGVRQDASLAKPSMAQALVWTLLLWVSIWLVFIPCLIAFLNPRRRAAHDILSGLTVIRIS